MHTIKHKVEAYRERAYCDCGGEFVCTGGVTIGNRVTYEHKCDTCGARELHDKQYPRLSFNEVKPDYASDL